MQQAGGALALMGEPYDADQAKFVPASAQEFNSTQVMINSEEFLLRTISTGSATHTAIFQFSLLRRLKLFS